MPAKPDCEDALSFFELCPEICCIFGSDGFTIAANRAAVSILGYSVPELRRIRVLDLIQPEDRSSFAHVVDEALTGSHTARMETRFRTADGKYLWLLWHAVVRDGRVFATACDVTEAKNSQHERFHRLFETSKDSIVLIDASTGRILECNGHTEELLGYSKDELCGIRVWEAPPFQAGDLGARLFRALHASDIYRSEEELTAKPGEKVFVELLGNRYREGAAEVMQANIRDISERRRAEAALRESEERFRMLVDGVRDYAIFMTDAESRIASWNAGAERMMGYSEQEILGADAAILFTPEDRERGEPGREVHSALRDGRAEDERWHLRKDGSRFFASGVLTPLWRGDHTLRGFAKVMRDITERKNNEESMREAQKLESIGLLAGGVAHDFNNLLTGIIGNASLAAEDLSPSSRTRDLIEQVIAAGERAADLTRQLLAYAGKGTVKVQSFSISSSVSEILHLIHTSISEHIRVELHLQDDVPPLEADPGQIQQIAMNLVLNAAEAIEGEGTIRISTDWRHFREEDLRGAEGLSRLRPGSYVLLKVEDTGVGMDEAVKARIFDPFFTTKFTGRGLGLAAVSGIVRGYNGAIRVVSAPNQGSAFEVYLPASSKPPVPRPEEEAIANQPGSGTILVVDDDEAVRRFSREALERRGYRVLTAGNGWEAVHAFQQNMDAINLTVLDLAMPVMSGKEAHRRIKEIRPDVPILISSGYSELIASSRFGHEGMEAFIQKPYTAAQLVDRVQRILGSDRN